MNVRRSGLLFCLVGPAGGGKTTIADRLLTDYPDGLTLSISVTTRSPRPNEREGLSYFFVSHQGFQQKIDEGAFFEWEEIHGNRYGTLNSAVSGTLAGTHDLLLDIDIGGALNFKQRLPQNTIIVFLAPPSSAELVRRLKARGSASEGELRTRLETAQREFSKVQALVDKRAFLDYLVVNDTLDHTYSRVKSIFEAERSRFSRLDEAEVKRFCTLDSTVFSQIRNP
jgi:guanylate kinase